MIDVLIGAGGWEYFNVPGDRLRYYSKAYKFVEVNSTFYKIPPLSLVEDWRRRVPADFEFTVRCNRELVHRLQCDALDSAIKLFDQMKLICSILKARIMHIQVPSSFKLENGAIRKISCFLSSISLSNPRLAWEVRAPLSIGYQKLLDVLNENNAIHSVDLSKETPGFESDVIYSRLFGHGVHNIYQFTNAELEEIHGKVKASEARKAYLNFHGTRMYKDAARMSVFEATGKFPKVTKGVGADSVVEVLKEDAKFPSNTSELIRHQGWKVCEWKGAQQLRLSEILSKIDERRFNDLAELEVELRKL